MTDLSLPQSVQDALLETAHAAADAARVVTLKYFRGAGLDTTSKLDDGFDPVTIADRGAEEAMRAVISQMRPQDAIEGEEFGPKTGTSGLTWVLDPIDGTRGFISGTPTWGVLIAVRDDVKVHLGVIDQPYIGERFVGGCGRAEVAGPHGTHPLKTKTSSDTQNPLAKAIVFTTFPEVGTPQDRAGFEAVAKQCQLTRFGMDCYAYALLGTGQIDLVIEAGLQPYDILGPLGVVEAAGGIVTDWKGHSAIQGGRVIAAANRDVHTAALALLNSY
jgi:histidinol phosphatase-like enzyme (inositol monophosphatase family)